LIIFDYALQEDCLAFFFFGFCGITNNWRAFIKIIISALRTYVVGKVKARQ
jgi:hypothetical protein